MIVLHGFGMNNNHWIPYILPFAKDHQFILPDLRGFGSGCGSYEGYEDALERHALDLRELITSMELEKPHLMGYSLGGLTILKYLSMFGDEGISKITLMDINPKINECRDWAYPLFGAGYQKRFSKWQSMLNDFESTYGDVQFKSVPYDDLSEGYQKRLATMLGRFLTDAFQQKWAKRLIFSASKNVAILGYLFPMTCWHVFFDHAVSFLENDYDFRSVLPKISVPTTIISGEKSEVFPFKGQVEMAKMIPGSIQLIQKNSGHMLMIDEPLAFYRNFAVSLQSEKIDRLEPA